MAVIVCRRLSTAARVVLRQRPTPNAAVTTDCFELRSGGCGPPAAVCAAGELGSSSTDTLYCRTLAISVDPFLRCRFNESTGVAYTSPYTIGAPLTSAGIGQVLACGATAKKRGFEPGDLVLQPFDAWPWATATSVSSSSVARIPSALGMLVSPSALLGAAGQPGLTAFVGVDCVAKPQPRETVIVSGAAGAVGSVVAQLCRKRGARVVGLCGSEAKAQWLLAAGIVDRAVNYRREAELMAALREEPSHVYWDNVGGAMSDAVIMHSLQHGARILVCGQISMYDTDQDYPPPLRTCEQRQLPTRPQSCALLLPIPPCKCVCEGMHTCMPHARLGMCAPSVLDSTRLDSTRLDSTEVVPHRCAGGEALERTSRLAITRERYLVLDHQPHFGRALASLVQMVAAGELVSRETLWHGGIVNAPAAFIEMMGGANAGKALVVANPDPRFPLSPRWRAAECIRGLMPPALRGWLASQFATEARMAAALDPRDNQRS